MLTMPEFQASTVRLEVLQHFVVATAQGRWNPRPCWFRSWLNKLGDGYAGRLEDPVEDVFVSRVSGPDADYVVFEGIYEGSAFYLQRFLNIISVMPDEEPFVGLRRAIYALLTITNEVVVRASLSAHMVGEVVPLDRVSRRLAREAVCSTERVVFASDELEHLGIDEADLETFIFDMDSRSALREQTLGHSALERFPLLRIKGKIYLALPTSVSVSIRRLIIEFCLSRGIENTLYTAYTKEMGQTLAETPILGGMPSQRIPFQRTGELLHSNLARFVDVGRVLHFCFVVDDFSGYAESGVVGFRPDSSQISGVVDSSIRMLHDSFSSKPEFREGITLVVLCPWARPMALDFEGINDPQWRVETISAADLEAISWDSSFSTHTLWSLLDALDALAMHGVQLFNFNGLLNLYAWSESLEGHLVPHAQLQDDSSGRPLTIYIQQNSLLDIRKKGAQAWDVHRARTWDGRVVRVRRFRDTSYFKEDADKPLYVSFDDIEQKRLIAVYETPDRGWWLTVETPEDSPRELHYRLWHALVTWLERAAPVLDAHISALPQGQIAWICTFEDIDPTNTQAVTPTLEQARSLLIVRVEGNVVHITAKQGFLFSFRHPTNIGERLLVEAFVRATSTLSRNVVPDDEIHKMLNKIIPNEWARDMHFFSAQRFREFVGHKRDKDVLLIAKADDALLRIGLGWRVRKREQGPRVVGVEGCCQYLNDVVESVWQDIKATLKKFDRERMLVSLVGNHEAITIESDRWLRTARSIMAFHADKEETTKAAADKVAHFNAASLASRVLMEMALCECPEKGAEPGRIDISRLMANVMLMHYLGGWSEAIRYGSKEAEIRIQTLGDIHTHVGFDETIATPYGLALGVLRFQDGADTYEKHFIVKEPVRNTQDEIEKEFWDAWTGEFGFTIDELRVFMDNLDEEGIRREELQFIASFEDIVALDKYGKLTPNTVRKIIDMLALPPRSTWASTPPGFRSRDWYPWCFRRRLSVISRPILQLNNDNKGPYIIAPGMVRDGAAKVIDYCYSGGYDAKDFSKGKLRWWIGAAENKRGHEFNKKVAKRFEELGWKARHDIKLTEILNDKLDRNYGDVDVLAWKDTRVLAIECKDLELAMTNSDVARQLNEFRGEIRPKNLKPDRLKKHLLRMEVLQEHEQGVAKFIKSPHPVSIEAGLVFSRIVPMQFTNIASEQNIVIATIDELSSEGFAGSKS